MDPAKLLKHKRNAVEIWDGGACNPRAISRAITSLIDDVCDAHGSGREVFEDTGANEPLGLMLAHLCHLVGVSSANSAGDCDVRGLDAIKIVDKLKAEVAA